MTCISWSSILIEIVPIKCYTAPLPTILLPSYALIIIFIFNEGGIFGLVLLYPTTRTIIPIFPLFQICLLIFISPSLPIIMAVLVVYLSAIVVIFVAIALFKYALDYALSISTLRSVTTCRLLVVSAVVRVAFTCIFRVLYLTTTLDRFWPCVYRLIKSLAIFTVWRQILFGLRSHGLWVWLPDVPILIFQLPNWFSKILLFIFAIIIIIDLTWVCNFYRIQHSIFIHASSILGATLKFPILWALLRL